ncbi:MAG: hypothetical protein A2086_03460 [Spirochaetes bacterium GWD1_27_9]|nr:MAG: hypothetical protein A2Z98_11445 [Spirochaetes bacterium GWB1_27_13]OHD25108.1 MAG: hypothetical protein A2Y34_12275 [Spirochaetes bacterium GWC1_27_15]OHD39132.1 MAG: hypothetical protein A2086_03460 [Spirochaetes bacterium GWD1_27_9]
MKECEKDSKENITLSISMTNGKCAVGENVGEECLKNNNVPVLSCEGACIRGEIARLAANYVSKHKNFKRGCHGELFTVPNSKIAQWILNAEKVVCIDGCFLKCHSRILENMIEPSKLFVFDALSHYNKYNNIFDIDGVPEVERKEVAENVAQWVLKSIEENKILTNNSSCCK